MKNIVKLLLLLFVNGIIAQELVLTEGSTNQDFYNALTNSAVTTITLKTNITISAPDKILPANKTIRFVNGYKLTVASNIKFEINGYIDAGIYHIFSGDGEIIGNPKLKQVYPEWFGAINNDEESDSEAIQKAVNFAKGQEIFLSEGTYYLDEAISYKPIYNKVLTFRSLDDRPGLKIKGSGVNKSILVNISDDYAIKVLGVFNKDGKFYKGVKQTNGYFKDFTIQAKLGLGKPKGGFLLFAALAFEFNNIKILGSYNNKFTGSGIYVPLISNIHREVGFDNFENLKNYYNNQGGAKIDNPDPYGSWRTILNDVEIDFCEEYGVHGENNVGFHFKSKELSISRCKKAGIYLAGHNYRIIGGAINACGNENDVKSAGIIVDRFGSNPNGLVIQGVEFDSNANMHIWIKTSIDANVQYNRFVANKKIDVACKIGGASSSHLVKALNFSNNYFRYDESDYNNTDGPRYSIALHEGVSNSIFKNNVEQDLNATPSLGFYAIWNDIRKRNNKVVHNGEILVSDVPGFSVFKDGENQIINNQGNGENMLSWPIEVFDNFSTFNNSNSTYTIPKKGLYNLSSNISFKGLKNGETIIFEFVVENNGSYLPFETKFFTSHLNENTYYSLSLNTNRVLATGKKIGVRIRNNNVGSSFTVFKDKHLTDFSGSLISE